MAGERSDREPHAHAGAVDRPALIAIRDVIDDLEPFATPRLDDFLNPTVLEVQLDDGLRAAETARIDVEWTTQNDYKFHYSDSQGLNFRWGRHAHDGDYVHVPELAHFHPPPDAASDPDAVEPSCIRASSPELVTRAVVKLWRAAYHSDSVEPLNEGRNPP